MVKNALTLAKTRISLRMNVLVARLYFPPPDIIDVYRLWKGPDRELILSSSTTTATAATGATTAKEPSSS